MVDEDCSSGLVGCQDVESLAEQIGGIHAKAIQDRLQGGDHDLFPAHRGWRIVGSGQREEIFPFTGTQLECVGQALHDVVGYGNVAPLPNPGVPGSADPSQIRHFLSPKALGPSPGSPDGNPGILRSQAFAGGTPADYDPRLIPAAPDPL